MTVATGLAGGFASLVAIRLLFGIGEAGAFPATARVYVRWLPRSERGRVFGLAILYGLFAGTFANAVVALNGEAYKVSVVTFPLCATFGFFAIYRSTFAYCWNRRAARLAPVGVSER